MPAPDPSPLGAVEEALRPFAVGAVESNAP